MLYALGVIGTQRPRQYSEMCKGHGNTAEDRHVGQSGHGSVGGGVCARAHTRTCSNTDLALRERIVLQMEKLKVRHLGHAQRPRTPWIVREGSTRLTKQKEPWKVWLGSLAFTFGYGLSLGFEAAHS